MGVPGLKSSAIETTELPSEPARTFPTSTDPPASPIGSLMIVVRLADATSVGAQRGKAFGKARCPHVGVRMTLICRLGQRRQDDALIALARHPGERQSSRRWTG